MNLLVFLQLFFVRRRPGSAAWELYASCVCFFNAIQKFPIEAPLSVKGFVLFNFEFLSTCQIETVEELAAGQTFLKRKFVKLTLWILIMDFRQKPEPLRPRHQHLLSLYFSRSERRNPRPLVAPHSILSSGETEAWKMSNARYIVEGLIIPQISLVGLVGNTLTIIVLNHNDVKLKRSLVDVLCGLATFDNLFLLSIFPMFTMPSLSDW